MKNNRNILIRSLVTLAVIVILFSVIGRSLVRDSQTLADLAGENQTLADLTVETPAPTGAGSTQTAEPSPSPLPLTTETPAPTPDPLVGASLNGISVLEERVVYQKDFYYEPLSDNLRRYITGVSYPENIEDPVITCEELSYLHILYYDFDGNPAAGELICNNGIAQDLAEIFYELYRNEYRLESVRLIDEYDGDDSASMEANNTSCFNYRLVEGTSSISRHAYGLAIDVNPYYNPYITYNTDNTYNVSPVGAETYADRDAAFPYKIDEDDLCYKLFTEHGFIWGGNWNSVKDYQHFQKTLD